MVRRAVALAAIACLGLADPAAADKSSPRPKPVVIAVEGPITGPRASTGTDMVRGVRLAVKQVNARGGVLGRPVRLIQVDDRAEADRAKTVARRAIRRRPVAVIGPYNSSVGIANLPVYLRHRVVPVHLTSSDETKGMGVTVQPKASQIAPVESAFITRTGAKNVTMLVDDGPDGAFAVGMATRLRNRLARRGVEVSWISVAEPADASDDFHVTKVAEAVATQPDLLYVSTYAPQGVRIAEALVAGGGSTPCLMGLGNVSPDFIASARLQAAERCKFSGVPAAAQLPSARAFTRQYRRVFSAEPGVWGVFAFDSANTLFRAMKKAGTTRFTPVLHELRHTRGYRGATGTITIDPATGYRQTLPISILSVSTDHKFVIAR